MLTKPKGNKMTKCFVLIAPKYIKSENSENYHIFEGKYNEKEKKIITLETLSICKNVEKIKNAKYVSDSLFFDLNDLIGFVVYKEYREKFCGTCASVAFGD